MRKWIRITSYTAAVISGTAGAALVALYIATDTRLNRVYAIEPPKVAVRHSEEAVARGRRLARVYLCHDCHGNDLGGRVFADIPLTAFLPAGNLTRGSGGAAARYSPTDWARAVLHGVHPDGRALVFMPSHYMRRMSDEDLASIVAFIEQLPSVDREFPPADVKLGGRLMMVATSQTVLPAEVIDHRASRAQPPPQSATVAYGEHLATATGCRACHRSDFSGGGGPPPGGANLTRDGAVKGWTERDFVRAMRTGRRPDGSEIAGSMPRDYGSLTDTELHALWLYLQSVSAKPAGACACPFRPARTQPDSRVSWKPVAELSAGDPPASMERGPLDAIVDVTSYAEYTALAERLRALGLHVEAHG